MNYIIPNYVTNTGLSNLFYISSNSVNNLYVSSNIFFNNLIPNYVTNTTLSNLFYISSNVVNNLYLSSNTFFNKISSNFVTNTGLSNLFYISSNTVASLYLSSNVLSNILSNYTTHTFLSNQLDVSPNVLSNILLNYTTNLFLSNQLYVSSNVLSNILLNYTTNVSLSNQLYVSSNARWGTSLKRRRLFAIMLKKASETGFVSLLLLLTCHDLKKFYTKPDQHNFYTSIPAEKPRRHPSLLPPACCAFLNQQIVSRISESLAEPMSL